MDFVINLLLLVNLKGDNYDSMLVVIDYLTKMIYYKPVKTTIDIVGLEKVIINVVRRYNGLLKLIVSN